MKSKILVIVALCSLQFWAQDMVIGIDPGHGGEDTGSQYKDIKESEEVLEMAQLIGRSLAEMSNISSVSVRDSDETYGLVERVEFYNNQNIDVLISLHINDAENPNTSGVLAYIPSEHHQKESRLVAENMMKALKQFGYENKGIHTANHKIIKEINAPVVMIEIGYIKNEEDRNRWHENKEQIANAIAKYILLSTQSL